MRRVGIGYRRQLKRWLSKRPEKISNLEITAEHFFETPNESAKISDARRHELTELAEKYPVFVHGLGLSLGTSGSLCEETLYQFARVANLANARWVSEHVAFTRTDDVDLGHLNPVPRTRESLDCIVEHAIQISERCEKKLILENITSSLDVGGEMSETEFLNRLCDQANCGLLLDVTNLFINSKNLGFCPTNWLHEIQPGNIVQLHVVGYSKRGDRYHDHHSARIQDDLMELIAEVVDYAPVQAVTLERDDRLDEIEEIESELDRLEQIVDAIRTN